MATQQLSFTQSGEEYKASYVSSGSTVVQIKRDEIGSLAVNAKIEGMDYVKVDGWSEYAAARNMMFQVDIPSGVTVEIISSVPVASANILTEV